MNQQEKDEFNNLRSQFTLISGLYTSLLHRVEQLEKENREHTHAVPMPWSPPSVGTFSAPFNPTRFSVPLPHGANMRGDGGGMGTNL